MRKTREKTVKTQGKKLKGKTQKVSRYIQDSRVQEKRTKIPAINKQDMTAFPGASNVWLDLHIKSIQKSNKALLYRMYEW